MKNRIAKQIIIYLTILATFLSPVSIFADMQAVTDDNLTTSGSSEERESMIDNAIDQIDTSRDIHDTDTVADNIKMILNASAQLSEASTGQLSELQSAITAVSYQYENLSDEDQEALSQSKDFLNSAQEAMNDISDVATASENTGTVQIEQTGKENSFRYVNGEKISDAINIVNQEQDAANSEDESYDPTDSNSSQFENIPENSAENNSENVSESSEDNGSGNASDGYVDNNSNNGSGIVSNNVSENITEKYDDNNSEGNTANDSTAISTADISRNIGGSAVLTTQTSAKGIDVSEHNTIIRGNNYEKINWAEVKASGINFAILRCGYGDNISSQDDKTWAYNVEECEKYGIPYGVYLYSYATTIAQIDSEVQHVLRLLKGHHPTLPVYIDIEENNQFKLGSDVLCSFASRFCEKVSSAGYKAGLYSATSYWNDYFTNFANLPNYYHWIAQVNSTCTYQGTYECWQHSFTGKVNGVPTSVDMDLWYGELGSKSSSSASNSSSSNQSTNNSSPDSSGTMVTGTAIEGTYYFASYLHQRFVLDVAGASKKNFANVQLYSRNNTNAQKFTIKYLDNGYYRITNMNSGSVLDVSGASPSNGANVQQYTSNNTYAQQWQIIKNSDNTFTFFCRASGKVLDISGASYKNGTNIQQYTSNNTYSQKFVLLEVTGSANGTSSSSGASSGKSAVSSTSNLYGTIQTGSDLNGTYYFANYKHQNLVLDVKGASKTNSANVQLYTLNRSGAQKFTIQYLNNGYYLITNVNSRKVLDVSGASNSNGANVQQYTPNSTYAQQWQIRRNSDNTFTFVCRASRKVLDISGASYKNGSNVQQYSSNNTYAQKFVLLDVNSY